MNLDQFKKNDRFLMLALDHRGSFKKLINPQDPDSVTTEQAIQLKAEIIGAVYDAMSATLVDPDMGLPAFKQVFQDSNPKPYLLPLEKTGYESQGKDRITVLEKTAQDLKNLGATGAKLLIFFDPFSKTAEKQLEISKTALKQCQEADLPLFLEIRTYEGDREADDMDMDEREKFGVTSLKMFMAAGIRPAVYKLEYPGSPVGCQILTAILEDLPWIMLTMGASFEEFSKQLEEASIRGCKGFLAGRALWQEVCGMSGEEKENFLKVILPERFKKISEIASKT